MSTSPAPLLARVSRRDLARDAFVWRATGGMTIFMALTVGLMSAVVEQEVVWPLACMAAIFTLVGLLLLRTEPPALGTRANHAVIALPYVCAAAIFWGAGQSSAIAIGAAMFAAPLAAVRLQNRNHFFLHLAAATASFAIAGAIGQLPPTALIGILVTTLATWVLGISCWEILQSAEAQGDELERLVRRDPLTGLGNRRLLDETLADELVRHARTGRQLTLVCMDLNGFKALNDSLGHAEGDALLREVGAALSALTRPSDTAVRQGGDEFCVVLPDTPADQALPIANGIRAALAELHFEGITTGIGLAHFPADATDARTLLHVGDERLYADKQARRAPGHPGRRAADREGALTPERAALAALPHALRPAGT